MCNTGSDGYVAPRCADPDRRTPGDNRFREREKRSPRNVLGRALRPAPRRARSPNPSVSSARPGSTTTAATGCAAPGPPSARSPRPSPPASSSASPTRAWRSPRSAASSSMLVVRDVRDLQRHRLPQDLGGLQPPPRRPGSRGQRCAASSRSASSARSSPTSSARCTEAPGEKLHRRSTRRPGPGTRSAARPHRQPGGPQGRQGKAPPAAGNAAEPPRARRRRVHDEPMSETAAARPFPSTAPPPSTRRRAPVPARPLRRRRGAGRPPLRGSRVVDVGAGTGIATRLLHERGARVTAVEPGAGMAAQLHRTPAGHPVVRGDGNRLPLAAASRRPRSPMPSPGTGPTRPVPSPRPSASCAPAARWRSGGTSPTTTSRGSPDQADRCAVTSARATAPTAPGGAGPADLARLPAGDFAHRQLRWSRTVPVDTHLANLSSHSAVPRCAARPVSSHPPVHDQERGTWPPCSPTARSRSATWSNSASLVR